jgi:mannose-6-phosphate isomerase-like protein (cupin superfamily)
MPNIAIAELPGRDMVRLFEGRDHGANVTSFIVTKLTPDGGGPVLHTHPYEETFILHEGAATFTAGDDTIEASAGEIVIVPAETPHKFVASGPVPLSMVTIHANDHVIQENLEG